MRRKDTDRRVQGEQTDVGLVELLESEGEIVHQQCKTTTKLKKELECYLLASFEILRTSLLLCPIQTQKVRVRDKHIFQLH